ncbi:MAG TPA: PKD domain-containing protein, partial [Saprospiraceae bacterium]|nr:PKD domain-containing protein [Saprospiraceae bacterium]
AELNPTFEFPGPGFYDVALIVNDFDSICFDTAIVTVGVFESELSADFTIDVPECDETILVTVQDFSTEPDTNYDVVSWQYVLSDSITVDTSLLQNPQYMFDESSTGLHLVLTVTSGNGCTATTDTTFDVNIIRIDFKGDTVGVCDGDSVTLFNGPGGDFTYIWSPTTDLVLTDPANPIAFPDETTTYHVTVTDGLCEVIDSVVVAVQELPILCFTTETDCRSLLLNTENCSQGGFNFIWDFGDSNTSTEENPDHTYDNAGVYIVTLLSDDGCDVRITDTITVSVITEEIEDESISCFAEAVVLNPGGSTEYNYDWEPSEFLDNDTSSSPVAQVDVTTTFTVTITDPELPGCSVVEEVEVVVPPDFALSGPSDTAYCDAPTIVLNAGNDDLDYTWYDQDNNLLHEGPVFITTPQVETSYTLVGTDIFGCQKRDTVTLSPTFFNVQAGPDVIICLGDTASIFVLNLDTTQQLSYLWTPAGLIVGGDPTVSNPIVVPQSDQVFIVTITNDALGCVTSEQVLVSVSQFQIEYTPSVLICRGESIDLVVGNFDTTNLSFSWTPVETIVSGANTSSPEVMPMETTEYCAHIVNENYGCETNLCVTVNVSWFVPDSLIIFVDEDTIILGDKVFHISTNQDPTLDFQWSGEGIEGSTTTPEITANPSSEGTYVYSVTVTNPDGCELIGQTQALTVLNPDCNDDTVFLPDAFSPNGDGDNDVLEVYGNFIDQLELHIYNRWGEEVFVSFNQSNVWDGTYQGEELAPDVFGYYLRVVCIPNKPFFKKGNITLFK